jgi:hypothetical protein
VYEAGVAGRGKCEEGAFAVGDLERFRGGGGGGGGFGAFWGWRCGVLRVGGGGWWTFWGSWWEGRLLSLLSLLLSLLGLMMRVPEIVAYGTLALGFVLVLVLVVVVTVVVVIR